MFGAETGPFWDNSIKTQAADTLVLVVIVR